MVEYNHLAQFLRWVYFNNLVCRYVYLLNLRFLHVQRHSYLNTNTQAVITESYIERFTEDVAELIIQKKNLAPYL